MPPRPPPRPSRTPPNPTTRTHVARTFTPRCRKRTWLTASCRLVDPLLPVPSTNTHRLACCGAGVSCWPAAFVPEAPPAAGCASRSTRTHPSGEHVDCAVAARRMPQEQDARPEQGCCWASRPGRNGMVRRDTMGRQQERSAQGQGAGCLCRHALLLGCGQRLWLANAVCRWCASCPRQSMRQNCAEVLRCMHDPEGGCGWGCRKGEASPNALARDGWRSWAVSISNNRCHTHLAICAAASMQCRMVLGRLRKDAPPLPLKA